jgi:aspartyl-tRNA(Asn)/glutamyl-tRNA(Gln) amidotransferase subunit C
MMRKFTDYESMAMLDLPESERVILMVRFDEITGGFAALDAFDTGDVEPLVSVLDFHSVLREDEAVKFISRDELLKNAPEQHDGYFQVPAAID